MKNKEFVMFAASVAALSGCDVVKPGNPELNVIYILADDLGYGDLGCYGQKLIKTPNIDRLAKEGRLYTQHYAGCTVSAPSRSALMTGLHTGHTPIRGNKGGISAKEDFEEGQFPIPDSLYTVAELFKAAGYATGCFGKWGLGFPGSEGDPTYQGFDEFFGYNCQALAHKYYPDHLWHNREKIELEGNDLKHKNIYSHDLIQKRALDFIRSNQNNRFFAYLSYTLPHAELVVPEDDLIIQYKNIDETKPYLAKRGDYSEEGFHKSHYCSVARPHATFAAMVSRLDKYVGEVMELVDSLGIKDRTLIVFTSDNGPHREGGADPDFFKSYGPFRGIKRDLTEGGIRVPFIASCPRVIPAGTTSDHVSAFWDMLPTFSDIAGVDMSVKCDGISFWMDLQGRRNQKEHDYLYWEFHEAGGKQAVRMGCWKGIRLDVAKNPDGKILLYDLSNDQHEDVDVAEKYPKIATKIEKIMNQARTPSPLFNFGQSNGAM